MKACIFCFALLALSSCTVNSSNVVCEADSECPNDTVCASGVCVGDDDPIEQGTVEISLSVSELELLQGDTIRVVATVTIDGRDIVDTVEWGSSAPMVATVDDDGDVIGLAPGMAEISASFGGVDASLSVVVYDRVASLTVEPETLTLGRGVQSPLIVTTLSGNGAPIEVPVTFTSSNSTAVEVDEDGVLVALAVGTADIVATFEELRTTTRVTVVDNPVTRTEIHVDGDAAPVIQTRINHQTEKLNKLKQEHPQGDKATKVTEELEFWTAYLAKVKRQ